MHRVSKLPRETIIIADEVVAMGSVSGNPDMLNIWKSIITAEERFVKPAMTDAFYYDFREKKNKIVTTENKATLEGLVNAGNNGTPIVLKVGEIVNAIEFVDDDWYKKWWKEFGWILTAQAVVYTSTPTNWLRHEGSGEMFNNPKTLGLDAPKGAQSAELKDVQWKQSRLHQDIIDPLIERSNEWLCKNKPHFPLFKCSGCGSCSNSETGGVSVKRKSGWVHDIYND